MANKIEDGGLAFPGSRLQQVGTVADHGFRDDDSPTFDHVQHSGMSLRDYFAGQALAGSSAAATGVGNMPDDVLRQWAETCYRVADAMISARKGDA